MENHWGIQSANFDLVNTYFGIDVGRLFVLFYKGKNLPCKSKMAPYYMFATSML